MTGASDREDAAAEAGAAPTTRTGAEQAAALDKVTDQVEEKEIKSVDSSRIQQAMAKLAETEKQQQEARRQREKELAAVKVRQEDIALIAAEFEIDRKKAERRLRECGGDVKAACVALLEALA